MTSLTHLEPSASRGRFCIRYSQVAEELASTSGVSFDSLDFP